MKDEDGNWPRLLLIAAGALLAAALVVGGVASMVALAAADFAGVGNSGSGPAAQPSLYFPTPTRDPAERGQSETPSPSASPGGGRGGADDHDGRDKPRKHKRHRITLHADPRVASAGERIDLSGRYRSGNGHILQVQRFEGGWSDFPVTANVSGGRYHTWVVTSRTGKNRFRVLDTGTGRSSKPVAVTIR